MRHPITHVSCTCVSLLQARQRAELNATDAEDKLKAYVWAADPRSEEGARGEGQQAKAMADLDASLMQRLEEDSATNHRLLDSLKQAQVCLCHAQKPAQA